MSKTLELTETERITLLMLVRRNLDSEYFRERDDSYLHKLKRKLEK